MRDVKPGIIAIPGTYKDEVVTARMLKTAIQYHDSIPLIVGPHPAGGYAYPETYIGKVLPKWNKEKQRIDGTFQFFTECWHLIPDEVQRKLANNEPIPLSVGYETQTDEKKRQKWRKWDHIALGVRNPLMKDVGVNVRMEEDFPEGFRIEEEALEISGEKKKMEEPKTVNLTPAQLTEVIDTAVEKALEKKEEALEEEVPEEKKEEEKAPEQAEDALPEPEPEMVLPASAPSRKKMDGIQVTEDGWWKF